MHSRVTNRRLPLLGGTLALDFVNTIDPRLRPPREDFLPTFAAVVEWSAFVGLIGEAERARLSAQAKRDPELATEVHRRAIDLREALYQLFRPPRSGRRRSSALAVLNRELRRSMEVLELKRRDDRYRLEQRASRDLDRVLWQIARSGAELLTSADLERVRECDGDGCGWLFLDTSKARRRRWCSMTICGNRAKAQRHRERTKHAEAASGALRGMTLGAQ